MKKFASLTLAAAMVLSLAGCGQQDTSSATSDNNSVVTPADTTSSEATTSATTSATTTSATTTTEATTASQPEEEPAASDPTAITGDVTLNAASSIPSGTLYGAYGDTTILYSAENDNFYLADINGEPLNDTAYDYVYSGFDNAGNARVKMNGVSCIIDKQGNVLHEDVVALSDGVLITREVTGQSESYGEMINNYNYIYTDIETGEVIFSIDEMADTMSPKNYNVDPMTNGYSVITRSAQSAASLRGVYFVDRQGNMTELYDNDSGNKPEIYGDGANIAYADENNYIYLRLLADGIQYMIYDMHDDTYTIIPFEGNNWTFTYSNRDKGLFAINDGAVAQIFDKDFNVLLDGLTTAIDSGCDKYLLISDGEKWGYYIIESGEAVWYDDATNFRNGYAFVIEGGKGHFVNEDFEAVTDDIAATGATHYDGLLYLSDKEQFYPVNYPAAE